MIRRILLASILLLPFTAYATLTRNMRIGDRGEDVRELQIALNNDPATAVALFGPGSPNNETDYFGVLTRNAVIRLQAKYAATILAPLGMNAPTGIVGAQTRFFLAQNKAEAVAPASQNAALSPPTVSSIFPAVVTKSTMTLAITGTHFSPTGNTVIISSERLDAFTHLASPDEHTLAFTFHFAVADALKQQLAPAMRSGTYAEIAAAIAQNIQQRTSPTGDALIPVMLGVKNSNGESVPMRFLINMSAILKEIGSSTP